MESSEHCIKGNLVYNGDPAVFQSWLKWNKESYRILHFYISTFRSMCAVPNMAVFCSSLTSYFPGMLLTYFLNVFEIVPVAPIITGYNNYYYYYYHYYYYRNTIIKQKINVTRSLLEDIKTKQLKWYGHVQRMEEGRLPKKLWNGAHQEEENEVDLNLPGRKRLEDWWRKRG